MKSKKKAKKLETNDEDDQEKDLNDEKVNEQKDEFNCCGIRHKVSHFVDLNFCLFLETG